MRSRIDRLQFRAALRDARRRGFTLIEVLVVVAIIALLVAILLPSLRGAREAAQGTACKSNMRQIGMAMHAYVAANGRLPGTDTVWWASYGESSRPPNPAGRRWPNWRASDSWLGLLCPPDHAWPVSEQDQLWAHVEATVPRGGSLWRYTKEDKVYLCPSDRKGLPDAENPAGGGGNGRFSFTMNGLLGFKAPENVRTFRYVTDFEVMEGAMKADITMIPAGTTVQWNAAKMVLLIEEHPWNNTNHGFVGDSWAADSYLALRHYPRLKTGRANFAYLDGHADMRMYPYYGDKADRGGGRGKLQGLDIFNEFKFPYDYAGNQGGWENTQAFVHQFTYPYQ